MKKCLFICNTPFQIMTAVTFRLTILKDEYVDIAVSDIISDSYDLYNNIERTKVFNNIYYVHDYRINYQLTGIKRKLSILNRKRITKNIFYTDIIYDELYTSDTLLSIEWIYELLKSKNTKMKVFYFEESPIAVLCDQGNHFKSKENYIGIKDRLLGIKHIDGNFSGAYVSVCDKMHKTYFEWFRLPKIDFNMKEKYVSILNKFWNYNPRNSLDNKIIFIEESFFVDNRGNRDEEIINDILQFSHNHDVVIKLHPRTRKNRFENKGVHIYENSSVPWELVVLNGELDNNILICVASSAAILSKLYWNIKQNSVVLVDCQDYYFDYLSNDYYKKFSEVCHENNLAYMPKNRDEFKKILSDIISDM